MDCNHHFSKFSVHSLKNFGIFWQLLSDIIRSNKNVNQNSPVLLYFEPLIHHNIHTTELISPVFNCFNEELHIFSLSFHSHQIEGVSIQNFHHIIQWAENIVFLVHVKQENLLCPVALNDSEFLVDFEFLLCDIDDFFDLWFELVQLEIQNFTEGK